MSESDNKELDFQKRIDELVDSFGTNSQEGVKLSLRECQEIFGCVSISHQEDIGRLFEMDKKIISAIIKFMPSIKESVVEYEVVCCSGSRCTKNGAIEVLKAVKETLDIDFNETTKDGKIRLRTQNCLKKCGLGPNIMVNGEFYHRMDKTKTLELMKNIGK